MPPVIWSAPADQDLETLLFGCLTMKPVVRVVALAAAFQALRSEGADLHPPAPNEDSIARILRNPPPSEGGGAASELSPEERFRIEMDKIRKQAREPVPVQDLSGEDTSDLVDRYLYRSEASAGRQEYAELQKRPQELKTEILKRLDKLPEDLAVAPKHIREKAKDDIGRAHLDDVYLLLQTYEGNRLPEIAGAVSPEFQVQVTKACLFHPGYRALDACAIQLQNAFRHLAISEYDESEVLDRLIAEGRLERGSEIETKWRKEFSKNPRKARLDLRQMPQTPNGPPSSVTLADASAEASEESLISRWPLIAAGVLVLSATAIWLWSTIRAQRH